MINVNLQHQIICMGIHTSQIVWLNSNFLILYHLWGIHNIFIFHNLSIGKLINNIRNSWFSCGFWWSFRIKPVSCEFCLRFRFPCNTFVDNCFLKILASTEKLYLQEIFDQCLRDFPDRRHVSCIKSEGKEFIYLKKNALQCIPKW